MRTHDSRRQLKILLVTTILSVALVSLGIGIVEYNKNKATADSISTEVEGIDDKETKSGVFQTPTPLSYIPPALAPSTQGAYTVTHLTTRSPIVAFLPLSFPTITPIRSPTPEPSLFLSSSPVRSDSSKGSAKQARQPSSQEPSTAIDQGAITGDSASLEPSERPPTLLETVWGVGSTFIEVGSNIGEWFAWRQNNKP